MDKGINTKNSALFSIKGLDPRHEREKGLTKVGIGNGSVRTGNLER